MALDVDRIGVKGVWYRHLPHRGSVWWRSKPPPDGRWQRGTAVAGFYLAGRCDLSGGGLRRSSLGKDAVNRRQFASDGIAIPRTGSSANLLSRLARPSLTHS